MYEYGTGTEKQNPIGNTRAVRYPLTRQYMVASETSWQMQPESSGNGWTLFHMHDKTVVHILQIPSCNLYVSKNGIPANGLERTDRFGQQFAPLLPVHRPHEPDGFFSVPRQIRHHCQCTRKAIETMFQRFFGTTSQRVLLGQHDELPAQ